MPLSIFTVYSHGPIKYIVDPSPDGSPELYHLPLPDSVSIRQSPPFFLPQDSGNHDSTFCLYGFDWSRHCIYVESYNIGPYLSGLFHLAQCLKCPPMLWPCIRITFIESWILFHCMHMSHFVFPIIHWWTFGLFPLFGYSERCYCEYEYTNMFESLLSILFFFL